MLSAIFSIVVRSRPLSTVSDFAASETTCRILVGSASRLVALSFFSTASRKNCCRWMRSRSEPSPTPSRARTKASACAPVTVWMPAGSFSPASGASTAVGRQTLTPPTSSMTDWNPAKSSSMKCWMLMLVSCSRVFHRHAGPP